MLSGNPEDFESQQASLCCVDTQLIDNDVENSTGDADDGQEKNRHINYLGYPLGLGAAIATGIFGGAVLCPGINEMGP